jgi:hypothetical protein
MSLSSSLFAQEKEVKLIETEEVEASGVNKGSQLAVAVSDESNEEEKAEKSEAEEATSLDEVQSPEVISEVNDSNPSSFKMLSSVDFNIVNVDTFDTGFSYMLGAEGLYFFSDFVGLHFGLQYNVLRASEEVSNTDFSMTYLDIPVGVTFSYNPISVAKIENYINLGFFLGLPLSKAKFDIAGVGVVENDASFYCGINLESYTLFPVSQNFALGLHTYFKYGLTDIVKKEKNNGDSSRYFSAGLGLALKFL